MKLLLNGGGAIQPTTARWYHPELADFYKLLNDIIDNSKPILYVPLASKPEKLESAREWFIAEMADVLCAGIDMVTSGVEMAEKNLSDYSCLFIGGGNTYKLLKELKDSGSFENIKEYLNNGGVVYGGSAGAIIFGKDINSTLYSDSNNVELKDTSGFNFLNGMSIAAHYTNESPDYAKKTEEYLPKYSHKEPVIAIAEQTCIYINNDEISVIGNDNYYVFKDGKSTEYRPGKLDLKS